MTTVAPLDDLEDRVASRRGAASGLCDPAAVMRIKVAPAGYLLSQGSSDIARQCELLTPVPPPHEVRVVATPSATAGEWRLDVASRDRPGLLAAFTGVLAEAGIDVVQAVLATWDDGGALQAFVVRTSSNPDVAALQPALEASLLTSLSSPAVADAEVTFHDLPGALYTRCEVRAADRPGLLHAVAVAFASVVVDVHAARVTTVDGVAHDRFDLSDSFGRKLAPAMQAAIRHRVRTGV